jgi:hypothetical protein
MPKPNPAESVGVKPSEVFEYVNEVVQAQNRGGVLVMTCLQLLIEKGMLSRDEVQQRFEANMQLALDEDGGCKIPLRSLLEKGDGDEHTGGEATGSVGV